MTEKYTDSIERKSEVGNWLLIGAVALVGASVLL
jgi:hypothetical protein